MQSIFVRHTGLKQAYQVMTLQFVIKYLVCGKVHNEIVEVMYI